nr:MAG TPA: hypothetical protein [Caudoviricetes sp.]
MLVFYLLFVPLPVVGWFVIAKVSNVTYICKYKLTFFLKNLFTLFINGRFTCF